MVAEPSTSKSKRKVSRFGAVLFLILFVVLIILIVASAKSSPEMRYDENNNSECYYKSSWWVAPFFLGLLLPGFAAVGYYAAREGMRRAVKDT